MKEGAHKDPPKKMPITQEGLPTAPERSFERAKEEPVFSWLRFLVQVLSPQGQFWGDVLSLGTF
jgi:hypothetical protein